MWGTGVGIDFGGGQAFLVFGQGWQAHEAAVQADVFRAARVAGLYKFLGDDVQPGAAELLCQPSGAITFSGIGVDAADVIDMGILFHIIGCL